MEIPVPSGLKGTYALTVEPLSGGPVHAARTLTAEQDDVPAFTVQTLPDDRGTVSVPETEQDLSVLQE
ncbi:Secreted protein OS=Streptomyces glaucescens OX=1907 GN=SGLAU_13780 PE=4 SV=1 [Streptomyces glaucescens]